MSANKNEQGESVPKYQAKARGYSYHQVRLAISEYANAMGRWQATSRNY
jgi:hypothetical protein